MTRTLSRGLVARLLATGLLATGLLGAAASLASANDATSDQDATRPGAKGEGGLREWTLDGPLLDAPLRTTDANPLSDQSNTSGWRRDAERSDEFRGDRLDLAVWSPRHRRWAGRQPARFVEKNVQVKDGLLRLWMRKDGADPAYAVRGYHTYTSAAVQARQRSRYGYYEVRAKPMNSAGSSSFWFAGSGGGWRTEIDVFELGGRAKGHEQRYNMNAHVFYRPGDRRHRNWGGHWKAPFRFAEDFHVFGLDWNADRLTYFIDGIPVRWVENAYWHQSLYLIFDSETMPNWLGLPEDKHLPSDYQIDYVRVWTRDDKTDGRNNDEVPKT